MKNKVLEMQVESAYDRGKQYQERLLRDGHKDDDARDMMDQLENKMQRVEDLLVDDKDRQNDMLRRQLEQRRLEEMRENHSFARSNKTSMPYNPINLRYDEGADGDGLKDRKSVV